MPRSGNIIESEGALSAPTYGKNEGGIPEQQIGKIEDDEETKVKKTLVYSLCLIQFLTNCALSQLSPFYPLKASEKNVSIIWIGYVLGFFAVLQIVSSALIGRHMHLFKGGRHVLIMFGSIGIILQIALMGLVDYI